MLLKYYCSDCQRPICADCGIIDPKVLFCSESIRIILSLFLRTLSLWFQKGDCASIWWPSKKLFFATTVGMNSWVWRKKFWEVRWGGAGIVWENFTKKWVDGWRGRRIRWCPKFLVTWLKKKDGLPVCRRWKRILAKFYNWENLWTHRL